MNMILKGLIEKSRNSLEIGKYFIYKGRPIKIVDGQFMGEFGLSNYWYWKEVLPSGYLSKRRESGYGGSDNVFKPIPKEKAVRLAIDLYKKSQAKIGKI